MKLPLKQLALRDWNVEWGNPSLKASPMLLIRPKELIRSSFQVYPIRSMKVWNNQIIIEVDSLDPHEPYPTTEFTTKNVEDWPPCDLSVFHHFKIDEAHLPAEGEFVSWLADAKKLQTPSFGQANTFQPLKAPETEHSIVGTHPVKKERLYAKWIAGTHDDTCNWINDHNLLDSVVSIASADKCWIVYYRAKERVL